MSLQADLEAQRAASQARLGPEVAKVMGDDIAALQGQAAKALRAGARFPALTLPNQVGSPVDIGALAADGPLAVVFYRGGWCPYCNIELRAYQQRLGDFRARGARLVAVTPELPDHSLATAEKNGLAFDILTDAGGRLADALGIRFELSPQVEALYAKFGNDLPKRNGDSRWSLPFPATYVVAKGGVILLAEVNADYRTRLDPQAALDALDAQGAKSAA